MTEVLYIYKKNFHMLYGNDSTQWYVTLCHLNQRFNQFYLDGSLCYSKAVLIFYLHAVLHGRKQRLNQDIIHTWHTEYYQQLLDAGLMAGLQIASLYI